MPPRLAAVARSDRGVLASSSLVVAGRLLSKFSVVLFLIVAARLLTVDEYGAYSYVLVLAYTFSVLADAQVSTIAARDVAGGRSTPSTAYRAAFPIVLGGAMIAAVAMFLFGLVDGGPGSDAATLLAAGAFVIFNRLYALALDMLRALGRFGAEAGIETAGTTVLVAAALAVAAAGLGIAAVLVVFAAHSLLATAVCHLVLRADLHRDPASFGLAGSPPGYRRSLLGSGIRLGIAAGATAVATRAPLIVLASAASASAVAGYSVAMRFADAVYLFALTAGQAVLPSIASTLRGDQRRALRLTRRAVALTTLLALIVAAVSAPLGSEITGLVFGDAYASAGPYMSAMMAGVPFVGMFWISWFALCAYGRERDVLVVACVCALGSLAVSLVTIPSAGPLGAAWVYAGVLAALAVGTYAQFERRARRAGAAVQ